MDPWNFSIRRLGIEENTRGKIDEAYKAGVKDGVKALNEVVLGVLELAVCDGEPTEKVLERVRNFDNKRLIKVLFINRKLGD
jgi:hypothetical protein